MATSSEHSRLLTRAAREHLGLIGCRQKGRSRLWFHDHGWWAAIVEFQPSSWSKGSYLNVGAMWLWHPADHWVFNEFDRVAPFHQFHDGAQFRDVASQLAERAADEVQRLRKRFETVESVATYLMQKPAEGLWPNYQAAVAASLVGETSVAEARFDAVAAVPAVAPWEWVGEIQAKAKRLALSATSLEQARKAVAIEVAHTRGKLGLPELPNIATLWNSPGETPG